MNTIPSFRRGHRKRISAIRLSSDSNTTLPVYTSPPWNRTTELPIDISDRPPDYPDSSEEADADIDSDDDQSPEAPKQQSSFPSSTPPLNYPPHRSPSRRSQPLRRNNSSRRQQRSLSSSNDPYLDSLLARSVHALELSNTLLQSSMSTQASLSNVLASDSAAPDTATLETQAHSLTSRISGNDKVQDAILDNLNQISMSVEDLFGDEDLSIHTATISQSLPTASSGLSARIHASHMRRPSLDFRPGKHVASRLESQLQLSNHNRRDLIAPAPRAVTMFVDTTHDPTAITLPPTLGLRSSSNLPPTPLPSASSFTAIKPGPKEPFPPSPSEPTKRAVDVLSSYVTRRSSTRRSSTSTASSSTLKRRRSKSPPPPIITSPPRLSRSTTPAREDCSPSSSLSSQHHHHHSRPVINIAPIEELSASSDSSSSETMHVDRTLESLRSILEKQPLPSSTSSVREKSPVRPSLLSPPTVTPTQGTSTATASISRLFTKGRHSTRPPSPPRHSALKNRSAPPTPTHTPSPSLSLLSVQDALMSPFGFGTSSGHSTPNKRISFAELPESYSGSRPSSRLGKSRSSSSTFPSSSSSRKGKRRAGRRGRRNGSGGSGGGGGDDDDSDSGEGPGWWMNWLLGAAAAAASSTNGPTVGGGGLGASSVGGRAREERMARNTTWAARPGLGSGLEDWAV